ncbi:unnamed protein product [Victoria cruziana]
MAGMDIDSPSPEHSVPSHTDLILRRLALFGVPKDLQELQQHGLVKFALNNKGQIPQLVSALLPTSREILEYSVVKIHGSTADNITKIIKEQFHVTMLWLQWLMFEGEPRELLDDLARNNNHHGVCGTVWGNNDIAYRCRNCEHDPTCAICVPCFQNGNHKDHDYSVIKTGGGCCDCGDVTAWKREGFCSRHGGPEKVQTLSEDISRSVEPVLVTLLLIWKDKLLHLEACLTKNIEEEELKVDMELSIGFSSVIIDMLMEFCRSSESLLRFIATSLLSASSALLDIIVKAERFLPKDDANKLHELILKLLGEPRFKYEFAKVFVKSYADIVNEAIRRSGEGNNIDIPENMVLSNFSVQIFTVPTLTPRLVKENNLLSILLGSLEQLLIFCINDGHIQVNRWHSIYDLVLRVVEDIRFVMGHTEVPKFVCVERQDICRSWIKILSLVQGMDPQRRATGLHVEEESESWHVSLHLEQLMGNINLLLVAGAFSSAVFDEMKDGGLLYTGFTDAEGDGLRHAKVGRLSEDNCGHVLMESRQGIAAAVAHHAWYVDHLVPPAVGWLMIECLTAIDKWLGSSDRLRTQLLATTSAPAGDLPFKRSARSRLRNRGVMSLFQLSSLNPQAPSSGTSRQRYSSSGYGDTDSGSRATMVVSDSVMDNTSLAHRGSSKEVQADGSNFAKDGISFSGAGALTILNLKDWSDLSFDVGSEDISIHLPLHRLFSLLLHQTVKKYSQEHEMLESREISWSQSKGLQNFFVHLLGDFHPYGFSAFMMEHPLRVRVFCSQVRAGMWRRNGHSVLSLCENYHSVPWCEQGLDLDLFMLQFCAALAPPEAFVRRIVERFGLLNYILLDSRRSNEYESALLQDMLTLIIQIVKERQLCGLSAADKLKRELIYRLVVGDATHSQLVKALPQSISENDQLQNTIDTVAVYSNPSGMNQGRYSLRRTYWKELDLYHPRWNSRDLQLAEERYLRFCKMPAMTAQLPRWTKVFHPLDGLFQIAVSRTVLEIVRAVVYHAVAAEKSSSSRAPDGVLLRALHLLSLALDVCTFHCQGSSSRSGICVSTNSSESASSSVRLPDDEGVILPLLAYAKEVVLVDLSIANIAPEHQSLLSLLVLLMRKCRKDYEVNELGTFESGFPNIATLIESLLLKFAELDTGCRSELEKIVPDIIFQLSGKMQKFGGDSCRLASDAAKKRAKARERQAAIMAQMKDAQSKFLESIGDPAFDELDPSKLAQEQTSQDNKWFPKEPVAVCSLCHDPTSRSSISYLILLQKSRLTSFVKKPPLSWDELCEGRHNSPATRNVADPSGGYIDSSSTGIIPSNHFVEMIRNAVNVVIHDPGTSDNSSETYLQVGGQYSSVVRPEEATTAGWDMDLPFLREYVQLVSRWISDTRPSGGDGSEANAGETSTTGRGHVMLDGIGPSNCDGIHVSSCGHAVHQECRNRYLVSLRQRYASRTVFEGVHIVDPDQGEFLCPMCRRFTNSVVPAPSGMGKIEKPVMVFHSQPSSAASSTSSSSGNYRIMIPEALSLLQGAEKMVRRSGYRNVSSRLDEPSKATLQPLLQTLFRLYFPDKGNALLTSGRVNHSLFLWDVLRYSLISTEIAARHGKTDSGSRPRALIKEMDNTTGFVMSLLLQVAQINYNQNHVQVLLRFRGMQLFCQSISSGVSLDEFSEGSQKGHMSQLLQGGKGKFFPDVRFWRRAADPIIIHDPFSSLMWVLFCLPLPFRSWIDSFFPLVHLFYTVCLLQALITCINYHCDLSELAHVNCLFSSIQKITAEASVGQKYFASNYLDSPYSSTVMIKRFTLPYLRRCALLWKLLKCSATVPFCGSYHGWVELSREMDNNIREGLDNASVELEELHKLQHYFQVPSLEVVLGDEAFSVLALKWIEHFRKGLGIRSYGCVYSSPAVQFQLIRLPHLYQDLLERYIKRQCPHCKTKLEQPALCLLCGGLCSVRRFSCCRESECQEHAMSCAAGIGVFLLVKKTTILLQRAARQSPWPSPYLDAFGEEDHDFVRGKPLYLNEERYATLTHLVVSHGLDRSSEVLRQTTVESI